MPIIADYLLAIIFYYFQFLAFLSPLDLALIFSLKYIYVICILIMFSEPSLHYKTYITHLDCVLNLLCNINSSHSDLEIVLEKKGNAVYLKLYFMIH